MDIRKDQVGYVEIEVLVCGNIYQNLILVFRDSTGSLVPLHYLHVFVQRSIGGT